MNTITLTIRRLVISAINHNLNLSNLRMLSCTAVGGSIGLVICICTGLLAFADKWSMNGVGPSNLPLYGSLAIIAFCAICGALFDGWKPKVVVWPKTESRRPLPKGL